MRVCITHWKPATEILVSKMTGSEYDLCAECVEAMHGLLVETEKPVFIKDEAVHPLDGLYDSLSKTPDVPGKRDELGKLYDNLPKMPKVDGRSRAARAKRQPKVKE